MNLGNIKWIKRTAEEFVQYDFTYKTFIKMCKTMYFLIVDGRKMVKSEEASVAGPERMAVREEEVALGADGASVMRPTGL